MNYVSKSKESGIWLDVSSWFPKSQTSSITEWLQEANFLMKLRNQARFSKWMAYLEMHFWFSVPLQYTIAWH